MSFADLGLLAIVLVLSVICVSGVMTSERRVGSRDPEIGGWIAGIMIGAWLAGSTFAVHRGWLVNYHATPPPIFLVMGPGLLAVLIIVFSPIGARLGQGLRFRELVALQIFRLPLEFVLLGYYWEGRIPRVMTFEGRNWDILTALWAIVVAVAQYKGYKQRWLVWVWNCFGFALLLNIIALAIMSAPGPLRKLNVSPLNSLPFAWPSIWILFCVLVALGSHLLIFRKLLHAKKKKSNLSDEFREP